MMKTIYVDMDGVLTDFVSGYTEIIGQSPSQVRDTRQYSEAWDTFVSARGFEKLRWHQTGEQLVQYLKTLKDVRLCILSSAGGFHRQREVQQQKLNWLHDHDIDWPAVIVPGRRYKPGFARADSLLIDDTLDVVRAFRANEAKAIHHHHAEHTIPLINLWLDAPVDE